MVNKVRMDLLKNARLSQQGFWLFSPVSILGFPVSILVTNRSANPLVALLWGLILTAFTYLLYLVLIKIKARIRLLNSYNHALFFLIPFITGLFRGMLFYFIVPFLKLEEPSSLINRVLSSALTTLFWLCLSNYVVSISRNFRFQYQAALHQYLLGSRSQNEQGALSRDGKEVLDNLQKRLSESVSGYLDKQDVNSFKSLSAALTRQINDQIRPLSKRILIRNLSEFPHVQHRRLLKDTLGSLVYSWKWFYFIITALAVASNLSIRSISESTWRTITFLIPLAVLTFVFSRLNDRPNKFSYRINSIFLFLIGVIPVAISELVVQAIGFEGSWLATFSISPVAPVVLYVLSLLRLSGQDRQMIIDTLEDASSDESFLAPSDLAIERAAIASYLHNTLQSELLALSRQLEAAARDGNFERSAELLDKVSLRVNRSIVVDFKEFSLSPLERLEHVVESWRGILDIKIDFSTELLTDSRKNSTIVQTIEEIATNISRYDLATTLHVTAEVKSDAVLLKFQSNGQGKLVKSHGFGGAWLNQNARTQWLIEKNAEGTHLEIEL